MTTHPAITGGVFFWCAILSAMNHEREGQLYCGYDGCNKPIGLTGQPTAYSSLIDRVWLCPRHNDAEQRRMEKDKEPIAEGV